MATPPIDPHCLEERSAREPGLQRGDPSAGDPNAGKGAPQPTPSSARSAFASAPAPPPIVIQMRDRGPSPLWKTLLSIGGGVAAAIAFLWGSRRGQKLP